MSSQNAPQNRSGLYYVIPAAIMDSDVLEPSEKLLYALLSGYADHEGKCFPGDKHLADRMKCPERTIKRWLKKLEDSGWISREIHSCTSNPFRKYRIITVHAEFKKCLRRATHGPSEVTQVAPSVAPPMALIESEEEHIEEYKENIEKKEGGAPPDPLPLDQNISFFSEGEVKMPQKEHDALVEKYSAPLVADTVQQLELYAKIDPAKFKRYKSHSAVIESWILKDQKKGEKSWTKQLKETKKPTSFKLQCAEPGTPALKLATSEQIFQMLKK
jgi:DNA-binding MarR family transcriptional regulator